MQETLTVRLVGTAPLLMRNGQLADPLNAHAIALHRITSKRTKSLLDHQDISRLEFRGSLWLRNGLPCVPAEAIEAALVTAGRSRRLGSLLRAAVVVPDSPVLEHAGPSDLDALFADAAFVHRCGVRVNGRTTMRTRPRFPEWSVTTTLSFLPSAIDSTDLLEIASLAGSMVGLGDFRPRFGRFVIDAVG